MSASPCSVENAVTVASYRCKVAEHYWVNQRYKYIRLEADAPIARITKAGQFYQLKCPTTLEHEPFLLRPMSVYGAGPEDNRIEFLYNVTGVGTKAMATLLEGGHMDIVGPLGNTFTFSSNYRRILVVARGVGLATMAPLIKEASQAGVDAESSGIALAAWIADTPQLPLQYVRKKAKGSRPCGLGKLSGDCPLSKNSKGGIGSCVAGRRQIKDGQRKKSLAIPLTSGGSLIPRSRFTWLLKRLYAPL